MLWSILFSDPNILNRSNKDEIIIQNKIINNLRYETSEIWLYVKVCMVSYAGIRREAYFNNRGKNQEGARNAFVRHKGILKNCICTFENVTLSEGPNKK